MNFFSPQQPLKNVWCMRLHNQVVGDKHFGETSTKDYKILHHFPVVQLITSQHNFKAKSINRCFSNHDSFSLKGFPTIIYIPCVGCVPLTDPGVGVWIVVVAAVLVGVAAVVLTVGLLVVGVSILGVSVLEDNYVYTVTIDRWSLCQ